MRDEELKAAIQEVRDRVRSSHAGGGSTVPDLMPLIHARDAAEAKVAAIGTVNPRRSGLKSTLILWAKRKVARALDWHVREQVEFNRAVMACVQATLEALKETHRAMAAEDFRADGSLSGAFCSHVVEHLPPARLPELVHLLARVFRTGALAAIETPNPECLEIFATYFYVDPTHTRPVPPVLLHFYLEEAGFGSVEIERPAPASDYAIFACKL